MKNGLKRYIIAALVGITAITGGCGKKELPYDKIINNVADATIYSSTSTTAITAKVNMAFKDMTDAVIEDLENAKENYGIDFTFGLDGNLDVVKVSTMVSDGKISYSNNFNTQNFTSGNESFEALMNSYLERNTSKSEAYVDLQTGTALVKVDDAEDFTEIGADNGMDNSLMTSIELIPMINIVADTMGRENAAIAYNDTGCSIDYDFALNYEILSKVPEEYRDMLKNDGVSYDNILNVMRGIDNGDYAFPMHMKVNFIKANDKYLINDLNMSGEMILSFDKDFDELKQMGLGANSEGELPDDYRFGASGNISVGFEYKNTFGYTPTAIFYEDMPVNGNATPIEVKPVGTK